MTKVNLRSISPRVLLGVGDERPEAVLVEPCESNPRYFTVYVTYRGLQCVCGVDLDRRTVYVRQWDRRDHAAPVLYWYQAGDKSQDPLRLTFADAALAAVA